MAEAAEGGKDFLGLVVVETPTTNPNTREEFQKKKASIEMGYVNDTAMSQWIPPSMIQKSAGTWTPTVASNTVGDVRTAADAAFNLMVPIKIPGNSVGLKGARLKSVELLYRTATAALDAVATVELEKMTVAASTNVVTGAAVTVTINSAEDTDAKRLTLASHRVIVTVTNPEWVDNDVMYSLYVTFDAAATSVVTLWGAVVNFDLRV